MFDVSERFSTVSTLLTYPLDLVRATPPKTVATAPAQQSRCILRREQHLTPRENQQATRVALTTTSQALDNCRGTLTQVPTCRTPPVRRPVPVVDSAFLERKAAVSSACKTAGNRLPPFQMPVSAETPCRIPCSRIVIVPRRVSAYQRRNAARQTPCPFTMPRFWLQRCRNRTRPTRPRRARALSVQVLQRRQGQD